MNHWKDLPASLTITDSEGRILEMNTAAEEQFAGHGGHNLIGCSLLDCHPEPSRSKLVALMRNRTVNTYTVERNGKRKMVHQGPWYANGVYSGFFELSFELPDPVPNIIRE